MEELFQFMKEAREMDRKIELEHATEQGREEGIMITIKNFIKNCKEKPTAAKLAATFDVQESFVQLLL